MYQNTGIAITSCFVIFSGEEQERALGVPFFYTGMQTTIVGVFCLLAWKAGWSKAPTDDNIFKVIIQNYQADGDSDRSEVIEEGKTEEADEDRTEEGKDEKTIDGETTVSIPASVLR